MKKISIKKVVSAAAAAVMIIAAALSIGAACTQVNDVMRYDNSITYFYSDADGATRFFVNDKLLDEGISGHADAFLSCDGTVGIARGGSGLYRIDGEGIKKIYPAGVDRALLSLDNSMIVFTTATEVHVYDHGTGSIEDIKPEGVTGIASIAISPDGSTVGYSIKSKDGNFYAYAYENGESRKLSNDAYLVAIGDKAAFWYYVRPSDVSLYHAGPSGERRIGTNVSSLMEFNRSLTEVTFDMNGVTYYSVDGSAAKTLIEGASVYSTAAECESLQGGESCQASVKGVSSLFNSIFYGFRTDSSDEKARTMYDIWYVDAGKKATALVRGAYQFGVSEDRQRLFCLVDDEVYSMNVKDPGDRERVCASVYSFSVSRDGARFYCIGYDMGLYYTDGAGDPQRIAKNVAYTTVTREGRCLFMSDYDKKGSLHIADADRSVTDIADNVSHVEVMPGAIFYYSELYEDELGNTVYDVFCSKDGLSFERKIGMALMASDKE